MPNSKLEERVVLATIHPNQKRGMVAIEFNQAHTKEDLLEVLGLAARRYVCRRLDLILYHPEQLISEPELEKEAQQLSEQTRKIIAVSLLTGKEEDFIDRAIKAEELLELENNQDFLDSRTKLVKGRYGTAR